MNNPQSSARPEIRPRPLLARSLLLCASFALLSACGGGKTESEAKSAETAATQASGTTGTTVRPNAEQTNALLKQAAALNAADLAAAAAANAASQGAGVKAGSAKKATAKAGAKFSGGTRVAVVRFYNPSKSVHFYTAGTEEAQTVRSSLPQFQEEGIGFYVSSTAAAGLSPVYRFFNTGSGTHFYTISETEKTFIEANLPQFRFEGVAYHASLVADAGLIPVRRFYLAATGTHFYTVSEAEAQDVRTRLPQYQEEGIAYYVIDPAYVEPPVAPTTNRLPHSGVTAAQCYQAGSDTLVACSNADALALNAQQDGHRATVNPMTYSEVPNPAGGNFARTECVRDDVTGLIWEGKEASGSGLRAGDNTYTNYDDPTQPQRYDGTAYVNPTQPEIDAASNSVGYVTHVNSIALCGYTDWRLPTADELQGIVDYGVAQPGPTINTTWFPNTPGYAYWSSSPYVGNAYDAWGVYFNVGGVYGNYRLGSSAVRLVRASQ